MEAILYRVCILEYIWCVLCWEVCPLSECPLLGGLSSQSVLCWRFHCALFQLHVQIPQSQSEASIQPHPPTDPVRRAKSSPSTGTVPPPLVTPHPLVGGPTKPPQAPTVITIAPTDHSPTTLTSKISDSSPNMAHKAGAPPLISVSTARKIPQLGSFSSVPVQPQHLDPARQRMMDRAIKARLYFLRRIGPNKFLIGGDSLESRFHVNIGPQVMPGGWGRASDNTWEGKGGRRETGGGQITPGRESGKDYGGGGAPVCVCVWGGGGGGGEGEGETAGNVWGEGRGLMITPG